MRFRKHMLYLYLHFSKLLSTGYRGSCHTSLFGRVLSEWQGVNDWCLWGLFWNGLMRGISEYTLLPEQELECSRQLKNTDMPIFSHCTANCKDPELCFSCKPISSSCSSKFHTCASTSSQSLDKEQHLRIYSTSLWDRRAPYAYKTLELQHLLLIIE